MINTTSDDPRGPAERAFRERMQPLLALADQHPDASELFIDGEDIRLSFGDQRRRFRYADFPGLSPRAVQAAGAAAAVFAGVQFGPNPPALPLISVRSRPISASPTSSRRQPTTGMWPSASCAPAA